jgi:hypothetical protein
MNTQRTSLPKVSPKRKLTKKVKIRRKSKGKRKRQSKDKLARAKQKLIKK